MQFNDGFVDIYKTRNEAQAGYKAVETLIDPPVRMRYDELRTGINRFYMAKQANVRIDRVLRIQKPSMVISSQDVAVDENGIQYRIEQVQTVDDLMPKCLDLSLSVIKEVLA